MPCAPTICAARNCVRVCQIERALLHQFMERSECHPYAEARAELSAKLKQKLDTCK